MGFMPSAIKRTNHAQGTNQFTDSGTQIYNFWTIFGLILALVGCQGFLCCYCARQMSDWVMN